MNTLIQLMGRLIERITNKTFVDYIQENIFTPANMMNTAYIFQEKNSCHAYEYEEETFFATRPDGGIYSNPRDFIKWEKALPSLLNQDLLNEAYKPQIKVFGSPWSRYQNRYGNLYLHLCLIDIL